MKKIISCLLTAALLVPCLSMIGISDKAHAITYILEEQQKIKDTREHCWEPIEEGLVKDVQKAIDKNVEAFTALMEKTEVTNDTTEDDLLNWLFEACKYSSVKDEGASFTIYSFDLTKATASKEGSLKATASISQYRISQMVKVDKVISKLEEGTAKEEGEKVITLSENLGEDFDYKTAFNEANKAIHSAMEKFEVSNNTTKEDILKMAQNALPKDSKVTVSITSDDFSLLKATTTVNGTLSATLTLIAGTQTKRIPVAKTISEVVNETSKKIDADRKAVNVAIDKVALSNESTKEEILNAVLPEVKNGTKVSWIAYSMQKATFSEEGKITASLKFELDEEERKTELQLTYPMLERKVPTDKLSLNAEEWNILRLSNTARVAAGVSVLSMTDTLQKTADIRETELLELFSHTRPNGKLCFTALPSDYKYSGTAENIAECVGRRTIPYTSEDATQGWIDSPGHYANMISGKFSYVGMGFLSLSDHVVGVQMFSGGTAITKVETSAGTMNFDNTDDMQREYLICTANDGTISYLPIDIEQMEKIDGGYKLNISNSKPVIFTIGGEAKAEAGSGTSFSDVAESAYYAAAVEWAVKNNVTTGTSSTQFSPNDTCTRAQILTFMWRALGSPEPTISNSFSDVKASDYYYKPAVWAYEKGMVTGRNFEAGTPCKRSDTVKYFWLYADSPSAANADFSDVSVDSDYFNAVNWAVANGITSGTSATTFSPKLICSRAQIVTFLLRAINILK